MGKRELKVGMSLWHVYADEEYGVQLEEYVIRSIKRPPTKRYFKSEPNYKEKWVYMIEKNESTWVTREKRKVRDKKTGRKGYVKGWADYIDDCFRRSFRLAEYEENGLPADLSFTKAGAYPSQIKRWESSLKRAEEDGDPDWIADCKRVLSNLKRQYSKAKKT